MGYHVDISIEITIPKDKVQGCLEAINKLHTPENLDQQAFGGQVQQPWNDEKATKHYSWVDNPPEGGFKDLQDAFDAWRYETRNEDGNIEVECFAGEKWGDDELLYHAIAPFVSTGDIYVHGEDNEHWKYEFEDGQVKHLSGEIVYK